MRSLIETSFTTTNLKVSASALGHKGFLKIINNPIIRGIQVMLLKLSRVIILNKYRSPLFLLSSFIRHSRSFFVKFIVIFCIFNLGAFGLLFHKSASSTGNISTTACPDGYAYRLTAADPHPGRYLACENFDAYFELNETGQRTKSEALLLSK